MNIEITHINEAGPSGYVEIEFNCDSEFQFNENTDVEVNPANPAMHPVDFNQNTDDLYVCKFTSATPGQLSTQCVSAYRLHPLATKFLYVVAWDVAAGKIRSSRRTSSQVTDIKPRKE